MKTIAKLALAGTLFSLAATAQANVNLAAADTNGDGVITSNEAPGIC